MTAPVIYPAAAIHVEADDLLRAQGSDPAALRTRKPALIALAEEALAIGLPLLEPRTWLTILEVEAVKHRFLRLTGGHVLRGDLVMREFSSAGQLAVGLVTIGPALETWVQDHIHKEAPLAYLVDSLGSLATEQVQCCLQDSIVQSACDQGLSTTTPLSPGLIGWPVDTGQEDIFRILSPDSDRIRLNASAQMIPRKSASFVMGIGQDLRSGVPCDYCSAGEHCPHRMQKK